MRRPGHLLLELEAGEDRPFVPAHVDCAIVAAVPAATLDRGGRIDRALGGRGAFRVRGLFHARGSLGRVGQQASGWDDVEHETGVATSFAVELADTGGTDAAVDRLRGAPRVRAVSVMPLATTLRVTGGPGGPPTRAEISRPFEQVRAYEAHAVEPGDERVRVAVIDTGVALGHPELRARLLAGYDTVDLSGGALGPGSRLLGDASGRDFVPQDEVGHGSHVAGVIGAVGHRVPPGVGGHSLLLPVRVLAAAVSGSSGPAGVGSTLDIDAGLKLGVDAGADVVNLSLGTPESDVDPEGPRPHGAAVRYARARGTVLVAASGNSGRTERYYPACLEGVLAVGAVGPDGGLAPFSTRGTHVTIHAPGEAVVGLGLRGYRRSSGTSHASPFVAGAAALLVARARRSGRIPTPEAVMEALVHAATGDPPVLDVVRALAEIDRTTEPAGSGANRGNRWP